MHGSGVTFSMRVSPGDRRGLNHQFSGNSGSRDGGSYQESYQGVLVALMLLRVVRLAGNGMVQHFQPDDWAYKWSEWAGYFGLLR